MTNSQPHSSNPPTPRQLSYLRDLALGRGQSFAYPDTFEEADREIKRLLGEKRTSSADRRREIRAVRDDMATRRGDGARVRLDELGGYGSSAHWRHPYSANPPTPRQLSYLRDLALAQGQPFSDPETFEEAGREIERLLAEKRTRSS